MQIKRYESGKRMSQAVVHAPLVAHVEACAEIAVLNAARARAEGLRTRVAQQEVGVCISARGSGEVFC